MTLDLYQYCKRTRWQWFPLAHAYRNRIAELWEEHPEIARLFSKPQIARSLFPGEAENDPRLRRVISQTKKALELFLTLDAVVENPVPFDRQNALLRRFLDRGDLNCLDHFGKQYGQQNLTRLPQDEPEFQLSRFREALVNSEARMRNQDFGRSAFQDANDHLDRFYLHHKQRLFAAMHALTPLGPPHEYQFTLERQLTEWAREEEFLGSGLSRLYDLAIRLQTEDLPPNEVFAGISLLHECSEQISDYDFRQLTGFFLLFLDRRAIVTGAPIRRTIFFLVQQLIRRKAIYIRDKIVVTWFVRVVFAALNVDEMEWLEEFLLSHEGRIEGEYGAQHWELSMLRFTFALGSYRQVIRRVNQFQFTRGRLEIWARSLKAKALYELALTGDGEDLETLRTHLTTFQAFVKSRAGLHAQAGKAWLQWISLCQALVKWEERGREEASSLLEQVDAALISPREKTWFREKLSQ